MLRATSNALCVGGSLLVLERGLLELGGSIGGGVLLLGQLSLCGGIAIDRLVLLSGLASSVSASVCLFLGLLGLETFNLLLCLGDVLSPELALR